MASSRKRSVTARTFHYYWQVTRAQLPLFIASVVSTLGFVFFLSFANPYIVARIVDRISAAPVTRAEVFTVFGPYLVAFVVVNALGQAASKLQDWTVWKLELHANYALATQAFDSLSNQSMNFHNDRFGGSLVSATQRFIGGYSTLLENIIYAWLAIAAGVVYTIALLLRVVPLYVALLSVLLVVYLVVAYLLFKRILPLNTKAATAQNRLSGELSDSITNILAVKTYGREAYERELFNEANGAVLKADAKRMRSSTLRGAVSSAITVLIMMLVVVFVAGGNAWFGISAGTLVMIFSYTYQVTMQFNRLGMSFAQFNRAFGDAHDMTLALDEPTMVADLPNAEVLTVTRGDIEFCDVSFAYRDGATTESSRVFRHFNLHIPAGQRVGLVGRSGSGKTTLTTLLLRLSNLQDGCICIDGQNIADVTQVSLRQQVAYVPQEPLLFHRSIRENIAYGHPGAQLDEVREAARKANALEFIAKLPNGFDTAVGERGVKLSGGQRQRIAIARAILTDAPLLVLDEATSALDSTSEKLIQDALENLMRGRTSLVVAHRLSTVANLDRIVVIDDGAVVEDGTHNQLREAGGQYAHLWNRQTGTFFGTT